MSVNILVFDDTYASSNMIAFLESFDYCVYWAKEFLSANYYAEVEPGIQSFKGLIVDLDIPYVKGDFSDNEKEELSKYHVNVSGWLWIKKILLNHEYSGVIIILSGHQKSILDKEFKKYDGKINYISKSDSMALRNIEVFLTRSDI